MNGALHKRGMMLMATMMCTTVKRTDIVCIGRTPLTKNQSHTQTTKETQSYKIPHTIPPFMIKRMNFGQRGERVIKITTVKGYRLTIDYFPSICTFICGDGYYELSSDETEAMNLLLQITD